MLRRQHIIGWLCMTLAATVWQETDAAAQSVGLVAGSFSATYLPVDQGGCSTLTITGQFVAPTPGYTVALSPQASQDIVTIYKLDLNATPPSGIVPQVLTTIPVEYVDPDFHECPYGVSVTFDEQTEIVGFMPARTIER